MRLLHLSKLSDLSEIVHLRMDLSYAKYEVFLVDEDENGFFDEENKEKLEDF